MPGGEAAVRLVFWRQRGWPANRTTKPAKDKEAVRKKKIKNRSEENKKREEKESHWGVVSHWARRRRGDKEAMQRKEGTSQDAELTASCKS